MWLKATHKENSANGVEWGVIGAITTADTWVYETDKCIVGSSPAFVNLKIVVAWLVSVLDYISDSLEGK